MFSFNLQLLYNYFDSLSTFQINILVKYFSYAMLNLLFISLWIVNPLYVCFIFTTNIRKWSFTRKKSLPWNHDLFLLEMVCYFQNFMYITNEDLMAFVAYLLAYIRKVVEFLWNNKSQYFITDFSLKIKEQ